MVAVVVGFELEGEGESGREGFGREERCGYGGGRRGEEPGEGERGCH